MALFLQILKIIGIVLLVILAILLVIVLVPVRYRIKGNIEETDLKTQSQLLKERYNLSVEFSYMLHLVRGGIYLPDSKEFTLKVLFFTILPWKKQKNKEDKDESSFESLPNEMEEGFDKKDKDKEADKTNEAKDKEDIEKESQKTSEREDKKDIDKDSEKISEEEDKKEDNAVSNE